MSRRGGRGAWVAPERRGARYASEDRSDPGRRGLGGESRGRIRLLRTDGCSPRRSAGPQGHPHPQNSLLDRSGLGENPGAVGSARCEIELVPSAPDDHAGIQKQGETRPAEPQVASTDDVAQGDPIQPTPQLTEMPWDGQNAYERPAREEYTSRVPRAPHRQSGTARLWSHGDSRGRSQAHTRSLARPPAGMPVPGAGRPSHRRPVESTDPPPAS